MNDRSHDSFIRLPEVRRRTGLSTATIYRKMERCEFPSKVQLSVNAVAWYESDLNRWIANPLGWVQAA
jgi:prophage regulatory protein